MDAKKNFVFVSQRFAFVVQERAYVRVRGFDLVLHFDFQMCFAPQGRACFRHLNLQKWSEPVVFLAF